MLSVPFSLLHVPGAVRAVPLALRIVREADARKMEPLDWAFLVIAADHLAKGHLTAEAIGRLVRVDWNVLWGRRAVGGKLCSREKTTLIKVGTNE